LSSETRTQNDTYQHDHEHHSEHDYVHHTGIRGWLEDFLLPHSHDHSNLAADQAFIDNQVGIRTVWLALAALTITSILQLAIVFASGSVALLADTAHNIGDGLNSIPLLIAFYLVRKAATSRYTYGFGRAEDIAGIFIVISIIISAGIVFWESFQRLSDPQPLNNIGWVAAAAIIGFLGNEFVAVMQIRVGNRIGSAALVADGLHARTDGLTSLAVLFAAGGAWLGFPLLDPIIGLLIGVAILIITWNATKRMWYRLMDAVEPEIFEKVETAVSHHPDVQTIQRLRLRWVGHQLHGDMQISLQTVADPTKTKDDIRHILHHEILKLTDITIEIESTAPKKQP
jgi:cation diffusion facilitator family transporter